MLNRISVIIVLIDTSNNFYYQFVRQLSEIQVTSQAIQ